MVSSQENWQAVDLILGAGVAEINAKLLTLG